MKNQESNVNQKLFKTRNRENGDAEEGIKEFGVQM